MPREPDSQPKSQSWQDLAHQIIQEEDPTKIGELAKKLNELMLAEEREKVMRRYRAGPRLDKSAAA